jgi:hypothetical protein
LQEQLLAEDRQAAPNLNDAAWDPAAFPERQPDKPQT